MVCRERFVLPVCFEHSAGLSRTGKSWYTVIYCDLAASGRCEITDQQEAADKQETAERFRIADNRLIFGE